MVLRCRECGNDEDFRVFLERYLGIMVVDGKIKISPEDAHQEM